MNLPEISGRAGIAEVVETMKQPGYVKLLGKGMGIGLAAGVITRKVPAAFAGPVALIAGIYLGLEMAAWMEEEAKRKAAVPVIDATAEEIPEGALVEITEGQSGS